MGPNTHPACTEGTARVGSSTSDALRRIAELLDGLPELPEHVVTVHSDGSHIGVLFGAGPDEQARIDAVRCVLAALGATAQHGSIEYGGTAMLGPYTVEVSTSFD
jgi:hypothetical protein